MAVTCPTLVNVVADDMCGENLAGVGTVVYYGRKSDLSAPLTKVEGDECTYNTPTFKSGKGLYKIDCKDEGQQIQGSSLGPNKGFKLQFDFTIEMVNKMVAVLGRALNNYRDLFFIVEDGDDVQIMYDSQRQVKFESDGIKTDTGKAAADERQATGTATLQPVKFSNLYVKAPTSGGWDGLLASAQSSGDGE